MSCTASSFGTARPAAIHFRAATSAAPTRPVASSSALGLSTCVSAMIVSASAATHSASMRSTRSATAGSLRWSDSKTSRNASPCASTKSK